jgi:putative ABC transport system ATP-binding protein
MNAHPVLVRAIGVSKRYTMGKFETAALHDVSLELRGGEFTLLMGPSGSGKTTLLYVLSGLLRPSSGRVELCGVPVSERPGAQAAEVRRNGVGFIFQSYNLFPALTALDNVAEVLHLKGMRHAAARANAQRVLEQVGLADRLHHRPSELSGGQHQRVAIARAVAGNPSLLVGDEPTGALDRATGLSVMQVLRDQITPQRGVLVVTHDLRLRRFADRIIEIEDGRIMADYAWDRAADEQEADAHDH